MDTFRHSPQWKIARFASGDTRLAILWLILRMYVGYIWLSAGWDKLHSPAWVGSGAGTAVTGFLKGALAKTTGEHPDVSLWYAWFIEHVALPHAVQFSYVVSFGELFVGLGLIAGLLTGLAGFFGVVMNFSYLFAGTVSINPLLLLLQLPLIFAWRTAGHLGLDRFLFRRK
jgi:thiosulfate dehydrogenase [quinone] large subunit